MNTVLEAHQLTKRFWRQPQPAVNGLDMTLAPGKAFGLLGSNGAGKTTTIKMLAGLIRPSGGDCSLLGQPSWKLAPQIWQAIGYVSENQRFYEGLTGRALVGFMARLYSQWDTAFERELTRRLDLPLEREVRQYSHGEKIKLALLTAMAYRPKLLILDEPFTGLDPVIKDEFLSSLLHITHQNEWTLFLATHDMEEVERLADEVGILERGVLQLKESLASLKERFRQIRFYQRPGDWSRSPDMLSVVQDESGLRYVHQRYTTEMGEVLIQHYGENNVAVEPMSLREIYIAVVRGCRQSSPI
jgi:ABC-2 type transport system ATP-binding protein